jgi:hypothetical protein
MSSILYTVPQVAAVNLKNYGHTEDYKCPSQRKCVCTVLVFDPNLLDEPSRRRNFSGEWVVKIRIIGADD